MPFIRYSANGFPPYYGLNINGDTTMSISWPDLIWSAISVGRARFMHIIRHGYHSLYEIIYRIAILHANLRETSSGYLVKSSAYEGLDPSEKSAISYFLGLTMAKAFCSQILATPWVMHLDVYRNMYSVVSLGKNKPDLIGINQQGDWIVVESKGRTNEFDEEAQIKAKRQANSIIGISGSLPILNIGTQVHFTSGNLELEVNDPDPKNGRKIDLEITKEMYYERYYMPFSTWLTDGERVIHRETQYRQKYIGELDVAVGLHESYFNLKDNPVQTTLKHELSDENRVLTASDGLSVTVGASWSNNNMVREPAERL